MDISRLKDGDTITISVVKPSDKLYFDYHFNFYRISGVSNVAYGLEFLYEIPSKYHTSVVFKILDVNKLNVFYKVLESDDYLN